MFPRCLIVISREANEKLRNKSRNGTPVKSTLLSVNTNHVEPIGSHQRSESDPLGDLGEPSFTEYEQECMERWVIILSNYILTGYLEGTIGSRVYPLVTTNQWIPSLELWSIILKRKISTNGSITKTSNVLNEPSGKFSNDVKGTLNIHCTTQYELK